MVKWGVSAGQASEAEAAHFLLHGGHSASRSLCPLDTALGARRVERGRAPGAAVAVLGAGCAGLRCGCCFRWGCACARRVFRHRRV